MRLTLIQSAHDHHLAGHPGVTKTVLLLRRLYYWPNITVDVRRYVRACASCHRAKAERHAPYGPLRFLPIPERPWSSISMDFIEQLPPSEGFDTILVVVDRLTKMALFIPTYATDDAPRLASIFLTHVFSKHGTPVDIVSDRGKHFVSRFWASLCALLGIKSNLSNTYHPETDGQTECVNQILEQYLRLYINYEQDNWGDLLPLAEFAYNNTSHSATGVTPFFANYGYHPLLNIQVQQVPSTQAAQMAADLDSLHAHLREQLRITIQSYERAAEGARQEIPPFAVGDLVWLDARNIRTTRPAKKLDHKRLGPFPVTEIVSSHARRLGLPTDLRSIHNVFHVSLLEPATHPPYPGQVAPPPPPIIVDDVEEFEVSRILDSRTDRRVAGHVRYLVAWAGYEGTAEEQTWVTYDALEHAPDALREFHLRYPRKPRSSLLAA